MSARMWFNVIGIVLILGLLGAVSYIWQDYKARGAKIAALESVSTVTSEATDALSTATESQQAVKITIDDRRTQSDQSFQELKQNDQTVNDWANQPLPTRLRDLDRRPLNGLETYPVRGGSPDKTD